MRRFVLVAGLLCAAGVSAVQAQVKWDSPFLAAPRPKPGFGIYLVDLDVGGVGAMVTWQPTPTSWSLRGGLAESPRNDIAAILGADVSGPITRSSSQMPLDIDWVLGIGAGIAEDVVVSVPAGVSLGHTFQGDGASFTPYATPRVILDGWFGSPGDNLFLGFAVDLGLDLQLQGNWRIRFGGSIGDREAIAIGVAF